MEKQPKHFTMVWVIAGIAAVLLLPYLGGKWLTMVVSLGRNIPQNDLESDYLIGVIWAFVLAGGILFWPVSPTNKGALLIAWFVKLTVTLGVQLFLESYYQDLDAFAYFDIPRLPGFVSHGLTFNGTDNMYSLVWLHQQVMPDSYHALKVSFSMVGLIAMFVVYRTAVVLAGREDLRYFFGIVLCPSILVWSSILGKEPIILLGVALHVYGVAGWYRHPRPGYFALMLIGCLLASLVRWWYGPILTVPLVVFLWRGRWNLPLKVVTASILIGVLMAAGTHFRDTYGIGKTDDLYAEAENRIVGFSDGGSANAPIEFNNTLSLVSFVPLGMFTAFFRPLPGEVGSIVGVLAGLENLALLGLFCVSLYRLRWQKLQNVIVVWAIVLLVFWGGIYAVLSYGNMGTAVRYRLPILPIQIGLLFYVARATPVPRLPPAQHRYHWQAAA